MSSDSSPWQAIGLWCSEHMPMKSKPVHVKRLLCKLITKGSTSSQTSNMYLKGNRLPFQEPGISGRLFTTLQARVEFPSATMASLLSVLPSCKIMATSCSTSRATQLSRPVPCLCTPWSHTNKLESYCHSSPCHPHMEKLSYVALQIGKDNQQMCPAYRTEWQHCQSSAMPSRPWRKYGSSPEAHSKGHGWCPGKTMTVGQA